MSNRTVQENTALMLQALKYFALPMNFLLFISVLAILIVQPANANIHTQSDNSVNNSVNNSIEFIRFPGSSEEDWQSLYPVQLMQLALSKHHSSEYQIVPSNYHVPKGRNFQILLEGQKLQFIWSTATQERVDKYHAVPFPIMKGLFGLRVALIHSSQKNLFESVKTLDDLRFLVPGQMHIWTDAKIFKHNQINVYDSPRYEVLFEMLANKRFDYFPRAIVEAVSELEDRPDLPITLDRQILIRYPTALYFYVHDEKFAQIVLAGLEASVKSGEFEQLFMRYHADQIKSLNIDSRRIIDLENPFAPDNLPLNRKELWISNLDFHQVVRHQIQ